MDPRTFLRTRGIDPLYAKSRGVKWDGSHLIYPLGNKALAGYKWRNVNTKEMYRHKSSTSHDSYIPFYFETGPGRGARHIHVTEGETDALILGQVLDRRGLSSFVIACGGSSGTKSTVLLIEELKGQGLIDHITLYPDADKAGEGLLKIGNELGAWAIQLPDGYDLCDFFGDLPPEVDKWEALQVLRWHKATFVDRQSLMPSVERNTPSGHPTTSREYRRFWWALRLLRKDVRGWGREKLECPWHEDRSPSMNVDWEKLVFHCPVCDIGGGYRKLEDLTKDRFLSALRGGLGGVRG